MVVWRCTLKNILVLPGDGIGSEIMVEALKVIHALDLNFVIQFGLIGGAAIDKTNTPLPEETLVLAHESDAVLLGAVGGPKWDKRTMNLRPEKGLLGLRSELKLFSNLRPAVLYPELASASSLKPEYVSDLNLMIVRELTGGIYFGEPRGIKELENGERQGFNTLVYSESEIKRIVNSAFTIAMKRNKRLCSVDKANVLECSQLWREVVNQCASDFPEVKLEHMYVDNAAMQLVKNPKQFDVMVTSNMFGDILSDCAAMLTGSIGMLPSASLNETGKGMYEPVHGSAPDIAGENKANPLAMILSVAMMLRYSFDMQAQAKSIEDAVQKVLQAGFRCADIYTPGTRLLSTQEMGDAVVNEL